MGKQRQVEVLSVAHSGEVHNQVVYLGEKKVRLFYFFGIIVRSSGMIAVGPWC